MYGYVFLVVVCASPHRFTIAGCSWPLSVGGPVMVVVHLSVIPASTVFFRYDRRLHSLFPLTSSTLSSNRFHRGRLSHHAFSHTHIITNCKPAHTLLSFVITVFLFLRTYFFRISFRDILLNRTCVEFINSLSYIATIISHTFTTKKDQTKHT